MIKEICWFFVSGEAMQQPMPQAFQGCVFAMQEVPDDASAFSSQVYARLDMQALASQEFVTKAVRAGASGVVLNGVRNGADIQLADVMLSVAEVTAGLAEGTLKIFAIPGDNPAGLLDIGSMSEKSQRLRALGWDRQALATACGHPAPREHLTDFERSARSMVLLAAAASGAAAIDTPSDVRDPARFLRLCQDVRAEGFSGKIALYQEQLPVIREVFRK